MPSFQFLKKKKILKQKIITYMMVTNYKKKNN